MITDAKLKFWIENNLNVLLIGEHGTGKTARVKEAFDEAGMKWLYFSASTLDPWVDFIGIPKEAQDEKGNKYIELIRPKPFAEDEVEAIFMDEYNRAPKKVRNAIMELIQFRSINGKKFTKLRMIWAAINPDDVKSEDGTEDFQYDVEKLDPAQKDRFQVWVDVPFKPDKGYFLKRYGEDICENAIDWWNDLDPKARKGVSPRRLDYALDVYVKSGDIRDVLPPTVNVSKLITELKNGSYVKLMKAVYAQGNVDEGKKFLAIRNNYDNTIQRILKSEDMLRFFIPCVKEEDLVNLMAAEKKVYEHVIDNYTTYENTIKTILDVNSNPKLAKKLKKEPKLMQMAQDLKAKAMTTQFSQLTFASPNLHVKPTVKNQFGVMFSSLGGQSFTNFINDSATVGNAIRKGTQYRVGIFHKMLQNITDNETEADYFTALKILADIIGSSHKQSLKQTIFKGLPELLGYVVYRCSAASGGKETPQSVIGKIRVRNGRADKLEEFLFTNSKIYA
jgi:hypothetical protein